MGTTVDAFAAVICAQGSVGTVSSIGSPIHAGLLGAPWLTHFATNESADGPGASERWTGPAAHTYVVLTNLFTANAEANWFEALVVAGVCTLFALVFFGGQARVIYLPAGRKETETDVFGVFKRALNRIGRSFSLRFPRPASPIFFPNVWQSEPDRVLVCAPTVNSLTERFGIRSKSW